MSHFAKRFLGLMLVILMAIAALSMPAIAEKQTKDNAGEAVTAAQLGSLQGLHVESTTSTSITLAWKKVAKATRYTIEYSPSEKPHWKKWTSVCVDTTTTITGLTPNTKYDIRVRAANSSQKTPYVTLKGISTDAEESDDDDFYIVNGELKAYYGTDSVVTIPAGVKTIGSSAFEGNLYISKVTVSEGVVLIDNCAFRDCRNLKQVILPASLRTLGNSAFGDCVKLSAVKMPYGVQKFDGFVFMGCKSLKTITLPNSICELDESAFYESGLEYITLPDSITAVPFGTFQKCTELRQVVLPTSITKIDDFAFMGCTALQKITLPKNVKTIGNSAFKGCTALQEMKFPKALKVIEGAAFEDCSQLKRIVLSANVQKIATNAFSYCSKLSSITVDKKNKTYHSAGNCLMQDSIVMLGCKNSVIPSYADTIGEWAFFGNNSLVSFDIPDSITSIGTYAFANCDKLLYLEIPESVTYMAFGIVYESDNVTLCVQPGSYAESYAESYGIPYIYD